MNGSTKFTTASCLSRAIASLRSKYMFPQATKPNLALFNFFRKIAILEGELLRAK